MPDSIRIAVFDDHPIFRAGLVRMLTEELGFDVVGEGQSAAEAIRISEKTLPDVILLDVGMPGSGLEAARSIATRMPSVKILMLTVLDDDGVALSAIDAGAAGYLLKGISGSDLIKAIWKIHQTKTAECIVDADLDARILALDAETPLEIATRASSPLSDLRRRILLLMSDGHSNEQIAQSIGLELSTVQKEIARISQVLNTKSSGHGSQIANAKKGKPH